MCQSSQRADEKCVGLWKANQRSWVSEEKIMVRVSIGTAQRERWKPGEILNCPHAHSCRFPWTNRATCGHTKNISMKWIPGCLKTKPQEQQERPSTDLHFPEELNYNNPGKCQGQMWCLFPASYWKNGWTQQNVIHTHPSPQKGLCWSTKVEDSI